MKDESKTKKQLINELVELRRCIAGLKASEAERKRAEVSLMKEKTFTNSVIDSLPGIFYLFDKNGRIYRWNRNVEMVTGYSAEELSKMIPLNFFVREEKRLVNEAIQEAFIKGQSTVKAHLVSKDGRKTPYFFTGLRFTLDNQNYIVGMGIDITKCKKAKEELRRYSEQLEEIVEERTAELRIANEQLKQEINERRLSEKALEKSIVLYQKFIDSSSDDVLLKDENFKLLIVNKSYKERMSKNGKEILGKTAFDLLPEETAEGCTKSDVEALKSDSVLVSEEHLGDRTFETRKFRVNIADDKFGVGGYIRDITERKLAEEALRESEEKYKILTENSLTGIFIHQDGRFVFVNEKFAEIHGYKLDELIGEDHLKLIHPDERGTLKEISFKRLKGEAVPAHYEVQRLRKDGETIWCEMMATSIQYKERPAIMGNIIDITDHKRMEEELKHFHGMKIFGQLAAGVAHEVRNPLNAILAITEALFQDIGDNPEYLPYLEHIRNQVDRLSILMKDLLEIGKPVSHDSFQPETVARIVTSTIDLWGMLDLSKKCDLRCISHPESEKLSVKTEIARLQQVVLNILQNAAQNSPDGSEILIQVFEPGDKTVNIHIIDQGTGIQPDNMKHVFEPFFTTRKRGSGLGLSIVKHFVESMGGKVAIWNNDPPPGCTVELRLPIFKDSES